MKVIQNQYIDKFNACFGASTEELRVFFAPGRVNLIGEHTDYNGGFVFPAALTYGTWAFVRRREDNLLRVYSSNMDTGFSGEIASLAYSKKDDWANYPKGVVQQFVQDGCSMSGMDILYYGNIPHGAGLSSSASIEVVTALAFQSVYELPYSLMELVQLCQRAENKFVGVNCGIMDQFAVAFGKKDHAMFLNCHSLEYEYVPISLDQYKLVITNSNKKRGLADSKYNERRSECEQGVRWLSENHQEIDCLSALTADQWSSVRESFPDALIRARVDHVIYENQRVLDAKAVLVDNKVGAFGSLMKASHESLRDLYEVTGKELDSLFTHAKEHVGCIGTRMTGAGFGGCTVSIVHAEQVEDFQRMVNERYTVDTGYSPSFYVCDIGQGACEITEEVEKWPY